MPNFRKKIRRNNRKKIATANDLEWWKSRGIRRRKRTRRRSRKKKSRAKRRKSRAKLRKSRTKRRRTRRLMRKSRSSTRRKKGGMIFSSAPRWIEKNTEKNEALKKLDEDNRKKKLGVKKIKKKPVTRKEFDNMKKSRVGQDRMEDMLLAINEPGEDKHLEVAELTVPTMYSYKSKEEVRSEKYACLTMGSGCLLTLGVSGAVVTVGTGGIAAAIAAGTLSASMMLAGFSFLAAKILHKIEQDFDTRKDATWRDKQALQEIFKLEVLQEELSKLIQQKEDDRGSVDVEECSICQEKMDCVSNCELDKKVTMLMDCKHMFHTYCIHKWMFVEKKQIDDFGDSIPPTCPNCRQQFVLEPAPIEQDKVKTRTTIILEFLKEMNQKVMEEQKEFIDNLQLFDLDFEKKLFDKINKLIPIIFPDGNLSYLNNNPLPIKEIEKVVTDLNFNPNILQSIKDLEDDDMSKFKKTREEAWEVLEPWRKKIKTDYDNLSSKEKDEKIEEMVKNQIKAYEGEIGAQRNQNPRSSDPDTVKLLKEAEEARQREARQRQRAWT